MNQKLTDYGYGFEVSGHGGDAGTPLIGGDFPSDTITQLPVQIRVKTEHWTKYESGREGVPLISLRSSPLGLINGPFHSGPIWVFLSYFWKFGPDQGP